MNKRLLILSVALIISIIILIFYSIDKSIQAGEMKKDIVLKPDQSAIVGDLIISHNGGGHKVLMDRSDLSFAILEFKIKSTGKSEELSTVSLSESPEKLWNGYLIKVKSVGWNGDPVNLLITKSKEGKLELGQEVFLEKYETLKNKKISVAFLKIEDTNIWNFDTQTSTKNPDNLSIILGVEDSKGNADEIYFSSKELGSNEWENYKIDLISFDKNLETVKICIHEK